MQRVLIFGVIVLVILAGVWYAQEVLQEETQENLAEENLPDADLPQNDVSERRPEVAHQAPEFTLMSLAGTQKSLSDYRDKPVYLVFWASSCPACVDKLQMLQENYADISADVEIVSVNITAMERSQETVRNFVDNLGLQFPVLLDTDGTVFQGQYQQRVIPVSFLINREGVIVDITPGSHSYEELREIISSSLDS